MMNYYRVVVSSHWLFYGKSRKHIRGNLAVKINGLVNVRSSQLVQTINIIKGAYS